MPQARIAIFNEIGSVVTGETVRSQLAMVDPGAEITVEINSEGGSVAEAVAIFNLLRAWQGGVNVEIVGWALSAASLIAMAGKTIRMHSTSLLMVHAPWLSGASGNAQKLRREAAILDQVADSMRSAYARTKQAPGVIDGWLDGADHWFTAEDALAAGLIDEVIASDAFAAGPAVLASCRYSVPANVLQRIQAMTTPNAAGTPNADQIRAEALRVDGERRNGIRASFSRYAAQEGVAALQRTCEDDPAITVEAAGSRLLAHLAAGATPTAGTYASDARITTAPSRLGDFAAAAADALMIRAGIHVAEPHPAVADLRRVSLVGMAERILSMHGRASSSMSKGEVIKAAMSTSDFPALLSNLAGKSLRAGYAEAPATHTVWTGEREVADFKPKTLAMLSEAPALLEVLESAEYKFGAYAEAAETFSVKTFGRIVRFTRQALINDELDALTSIPNTQGAAARRLEADIVYNKLNSNPVMSDGKALFHADHGNLMNAAALDVTALGLARAAMRKQKGMNGTDYIDPQPRFLIVPVTLETKTEAMLSALDPGKSNTENVEWIRRLTLVSDPRLDANSITAWYLATDPRQIEGIVRAYLAGEPRPFLDDKEGWVSDTMDYKVRLDIGAGVIDYRGLLKNPGA